MFPPPAETGDKERVKVTWKYRRPLDIRLGQGQCHACLPVIGQVHIKLLGRTFAHYEAMAAE